MKSQFARKHTFEALTEAEQIEFCKEMLQAWEVALQDLQSLKERHDHCKDRMKWYDLERKDVEKHAIERGIAHKHAQDFNVKAKEAYVQTRMMFTWK